jgi:signal transduction histidine kinase
VLKKSKTRDTHPHIEENMEELIGEVKQLKEKLLFFEQLAIMGKLIICSAHELNNLLEEIKGFLSLLQDKENDPATKESHLTEALEGLHKMSLIIKSLLSYTNPRQ